jgi:membrane fusion protein, multidrug efflux system
MKLKLLFQLSTFAFLGIGMSNCGTNIAKEKDSDNSISVRLASVETQTINKPILASGLVASSSEARLAFKTGGVIDKILVKEGQSVLRGQLLATLNLTEISAQVNQAKEGVAKAERDLNRVKNLYSDSVATLESYQNANTAYTVAKQNLQIASFNQNYSEIRSPLTGKVLRKMVNEGEIVAPGTSVFFVSATQSNDWIINVGLADRDWARLKIGDKAKISLDAYPDQELEAYVSQMAETADPSTGTFEVELAIKSLAEIKLASGLMASVEIIPAQNKPQTLIPLEALVESSGKIGFVYTIDEKQIARRVQVRVAFLTNDKVVISKGLENVKQVVTSGSPYLTEGQKVIAAK